MKTSEYNNDISLHVNLDKSLCICAYQVVYLIRDMFPKSSISYRYDWVEHGTSFIENLHDIRRRLIFAITTNSGEYAALKMQLRKLGDNTFECYSKSLSEVITYSFIKIKSNEK